MSVELISARLMAPFFGGSLYVITAVLGVTMLSLLIGYYLGGQICKRDLYNKYVTPFLLIAGIYVSVIPLISKFILSPLTGMGIAMGSIIGGFILISIPLILFGAISPQLVQQLNDLKAKAGLASGNIYSVSTLGGVLGTFVVGLFLVPMIGTKITALIAGGLCVLVSMLHFAKAKKYVSVVVAMLLFASSAWAANSLHHKHIPGNSKLLYESEGILGNIEVYHIGEHHRGLLNNGILQSHVDINNYESSMLYTHAIGTIASLILPNKRKKAVIVGIAAGSLIKEVRDLGYETIYGVDIDPRTAMIAEKYFGIDPNWYHFVEDDGRHFLNETNEIFDLIVMDVSSGEDQPYHLYTKEAFETYISKLDKNGIIIVNVVDKRNNDDAKLTLRVGDGMIAAGLNSNLMRTFYPPNMTEDRIEQHIVEKLIIGSPSNYEKLSIEFNEMNDCCRKFQYSHFVKKNLFKMSFPKNNILDKPFYDDCPEMEVMNFERINLLRSKYLNTH